MEWIRGFLVLAYLNLLFFITALGVGSILHSIYGSVAGFNKTLQNRS
ncbi:MULTISPECIES: hypothetical protein [unclassified Archaeoglobus]|nr:MULTISPECIES: hypothetical protein [unclassified Archaeoglobus]